VKFLAKLDAALLGLVDHAVLEVWNRFEVPRITLIRAAFVTYLVGRFTVWMTEGKMDGAAWVWLVCMLVNGAVEEFNAARFAPRMLNAVVMRWRTHPLGLLVRWMAITIPVQAYGDLMVLDLASSLAGAGFFLLVQAMVPEKPPQRRKPAPIAKTQGVFS